MPWNGTDGVHISNERVWVMFSQVVFIHWSKVSRRWWFLRNECLKEVGEQRCHRGFNKMTGSNVCDWVLVNSARSVAMAGRLEHQPPLTHVGAWSLFAWKAGGKKAGYTHTYAHVHKHVRVYKYIYIHMHTYIYNYAAISPYKLRIDAAHCVDN